jgi:hypothetical protein
MRNDFIKGSGLRTLDNMLTFTSSLITDFLGLSSNNSSSCRLLILVFILVTFLLGLRLGGEYSLRLKFKLNPFFHCRCRNDEMLLLSLKTSVECPSKRDRGFLGETTFYSGSLYSFLI